MPAILAETDIVFSVPVCLSLCLHKKLNEMGTFDLYLCPWWLTLMTVHRQRCQPGNF